MQRSDEENLMLAESIDVVDGINAKFYSRFPYPWAPIKFQCSADPELETMLLNQSLGDWDHGTVPSAPEIWVAGCGTNQAVYTALRFPHGRVLGSDLSDSSLQICSQTAAQLGITNLELRQESINDAPYKDRFDLVLSTGVIHHNADPAVPLARLAAAAKPTGVLELMVYNRFHRLLPSNFQKVVRILGGDDPAAVDFETELELTRRLIDAFPGRNLMGGLLRQNKGAPEAMLADVLMQPVERSYTVESFEALAAGCGLELVAPCLNRFDQAMGRLSWYVDLGDPEVQKVYDALPDNRRWQVSNLLLFEQSPMIWFYLQRSDCGRPRRSERQVCEQFLDRQFERVRADQRVFLRTGDEGYAPSPEGGSSALPGDEPTARVLAEVGPGTTIRQIFRRLGLPESFGAVNQMRVRTTTSSFPHLRSLPLEPRPARPGDEGEAGREDRDRSNLGKLRRVAPKPIAID